MSNDFINVVRNDRIVIVYNSHTKHYFGFMKEHSMFCSQGNDIESVESKIEKYFNDYIDRINLENLY